MRTGTLRRNVQHLSRAFTASRFSSVSYEANLRSVTFLAWSKLVEQLWKSSTILGQGIGQGTCSPAGDIRVSFKRGRARYFCIVSGRVFEGQSTVPTSNSAYAGAISRRLCSLSNNQYSKLCFELIPGSTQVSNPSSGGSVRWDISEMMIPSTLPSQGKSADRNSVPPEREGEVDVGEERIRVTKVRKKKDDNKMRIDDGGIEWGQQHARVRENETRQREGLSASPPLKLQKDDVYIPVKACYISRR
ncbi:uncharacterized protein [Physcomitrium patens]|uniref:uncharacterized protein n=1 Tax=Physcomitrium patens TaxID=3218 RepID=UPI000D15BDC1|nr:uncharacterized protein LOC112273030 isoform X1 [Physcomitrium patens]XP_024357238.1 uncharacterized protein LOC112273030 isoform X1 [Physcomitrium patens]|eukprot:XP_024357154.1 uncharacterized protein LOC112273030 isoform X1 [Physcomitrella patens]